MRVIKILIIADDFTGALDGSVKFAAIGAHTKVIQYADIDDIHHGDVLVIDAQTRHLTPKEAYNRVYSIAQFGLKHHCKYFYKKTDSALRGNIGAELTALMDATKEKRLHFIPAFPKLGRTTKRGIHFINQVPLAESIFADDPLNPTSISEVSGIIATQSSVHCSNPEEVNEKGIIIYDAGCEEDLQKIADQYESSQVPKIMAGCSGFAAYLPKLIGIQTETVKNITLEAKLVVICGTMNEVTKAQIEYAEKSGIKRIRLHNKQKFYTEYFDTYNGKADLATISNIVKDNQCTIIDVNGPDEIDHSGMTVDEKSKRIPISLAIIAKYILENNQNTCFLITGGDTLLGFLQNNGIKIIQPIKELYEGVVLSEVIYNNRKVQVISKSGAFGGVDLVMSLIDKLDKRERVLDEKLLFEITE